MKRWLVALALAAGLSAEAQPLTGGLLGRGASYSTFVPPAGCASGYVPYFNADLDLVCSPTVWNPTTRSLDVTDGRVQAGNLNAVPLPASGSVTVTPVLSKIGAITVVAGSALADGDALSVGDGVGVVPIEFDAAPGDGTTGGAVPIIFDGTETATQIRDAVKAILDASGRDWTTSAQGADGIGLVRATPGATGGAITESVTDAGFSVTDWTDPTHATTYTYSLQACYADGSCNAAGPASSTAAGVATLSTANPNRLTWSGVPGSALYKIRRDVGGATQGVIWSGTATTVDDTGLAGDGSAKPTVDGTGTLTGRGVLARGSTVAVGAGTATATVGGVLHVNTTEKATTGTSEEVLATYTLPANTLSADGKAIRITASFKHAANTNSTVERIRFGGISGDLVASMSFSVNGGEAVLTATIIRTGATTQAAYGIGFPDATPPVVVATPSQTLTNAIDVVVTGTTSTSAGDVTFLTLLVEALN